MAGHAAGRLCANPALHFKRHHRARRAHPRLLPQKGSQRAQTDAQHGRHECAGRAAGRHAHVPRGWRAGRAVLLRRAHRRRAHPGGADRTGHRALSERLHRGAHGGLSHAAPGRHAAAGRYPAWQDGCQAEGLGVGAGAGHRCALGAHQHRHRLCGRAGRRPGAQSAQTGAGRLIGECA